MRTVKVLEVLILFLAGIGVVGWTIFSKLQGQNVKEMAVQVLLCVAFLVWRITAMKTFKEIRATENMASKSTESFSHRSSFLSFCHRGKNLFGNE